MKRLLFPALAVLGVLSSSVTRADDIFPAVPDTAMLQRPFDAQDFTYFKSPSKGFYPETWFHLIHGNINRDGLTKDIEAIAESGIAGIQLFNGMGDPIDWKGVDKPVVCLSSQWDSLVTHAATVARSKGLRFSMQNCPGWAMSGGPWIDLDHCMRNIAYTRTIIKGGKSVNLVIPPASTDKNSDYRDIAVLAFPTPTGDSQQPLFEGKYTFKPATDKPHVIDIELKDTATARSLVFCPISQMNDDHYVDTDIDIRMEAIDAEGKAHEILNTVFPDANWQDWRTMTFALSEYPCVKHYRVYIKNRYDMDIKSMQLFTSPRQMDWEGDAGWTNRTLMPTSFIAKQSAGCYINPDDVLDLTSSMTKDGKLTWKAPEGDWTILRIGHVNTGARNSPAPEEATGWECDKFSTDAADIHFRNYIGRFANGQMRGKLCNMLMDSWECGPQTWTASMPEDFKRTAGYELAKWMPALIGYEMKDPETTSRFLYDWRHTLNSLYVNNYFGRMAYNAHKNGLTIEYETAPGDVVPADCMEYYKWADVPMCEFWQPFGRHDENFNFKPIYPTVSAAHIYGKPRVSAESFTTFDLTWDEHFQMLKDISNLRLAKGVTHLIFHTYTHNPDPDTYLPGTSFGAGIGTPFIRKQTWWKHMPAFTTYLARCCYMLERGKPVVDVLWYIGDEPQQKPRQDAYFPEGFHYDYCNADALLNRLDVKDGRWITPDGISYALLWIPERGRMCPETLERLCYLVEKGGIVVGDEPTDLATLGTSDNEQVRYDNAVHTLWQSSDNVNNLGKGMVIRGTGIDDALKMLNLKADVKGIGDRWLHRKAEGADWYFVCSDKQTTFTGNVTFNNTGEVSLWNPVNGDVSYPTCETQEGTTTLHLDMPVAGNCFVMFRHDVSDGNESHDWKETEIRDLTGSKWTIDFAKGWGNDEEQTTTELQPWKDLALTDEGKAYSGTATYRTTLKVDRIDKAARYILQLGKVEMIAVVRVNGKEISTLWTEPYETDITAALHKGKNNIEIDVTSTWFNRLAFDANLPENERKTWTIVGPEKHQPLRDSGLLGPVRLVVEK